ncbi:MAG: hypothetical protein Q8R05_03530 [Candidatus Omnitrophota bacterium]|nr:hypothetical protein [Candidatus Omnitrophota bacterium]
MITLEFSVAAALYLSLVTGIFFVYWMFFERSSASGGESAADRYVWQCPICTYCYIDSRHSAISVCPRCGSYNKKQESIPQKEVKG